MSWLRANFEYVASWLLVFISIYLAVGCVITEEIELAIFFALLCAMGFAGVLYFDQIAIARMTGDD